MCESVRNWTCNIKKFLFKVNGVENRASFCPIWCIHRPSPFKKPRFHSKEIMKIIWLIVSKEKLCSINMNGEKKRLSMSMIHRFVVNLNLSREKSLQYFSVIYLSIVACLRLRFFTRKTNTRESEKKDIETFKMWLTLFGAVSYIPRQMNLLKSHVKSFQFSGIKYSMSAMRGRILFRDNTIVNFSIFAGSSDGVINKYWKTSAT